MKPSKKLLIADPKLSPMPYRPPTPPNSASSSSVIATMPPDKRTRDQPNLSDCHCCGLHINPTNPKSRLLPMDSLWRIVLLCRKCRKSLRSGESCTYCFKRTEDSGNLVECRVCECKIHEDCVRDYANSTPWCYLGARFEGFRVCVDCWIPDMLKNSFRDSGRSKEGYTDDNGVGKCNHGKKIKKASNSKDQALRNVIPAKQAVDVGDKDVRDDKKDETSDCSDAELAIQLHRAINSSPRTSRSKFLLNSSTVGVMEIRNWNGLSYTRCGSGRGREKCQKMSACIKTGENGSSSNVNIGVGTCTYKRDKKRKLWERNLKNATVFESEFNQLGEFLHLDDARPSCSTDVSEHSACVDPNESGPPLKIDGHISKSVISAHVDQTAFRININRFGERPTVYRRTKYKQKGQLNSLIDVSVDCRICDGDRLSDKPAKCQGDEAKEIMPNGSSDATQDRYLRKYVKRRNSTKSSRLQSETAPGANKASASAASSNTGSNESLKIDGELILPNGGSYPKLDPCHFKYAKRVKR